MEKWRRRKGLMRGRRYATVFEPIERERLGDLAAAVADALIARARSAPRDELAELTGMPSGHKDAPEDPSLARLLPDFERADDEQFEGENSLLRSLHEQDITRGKLEGLRVIIDKLGPDGGVAVTLDEAEARAWLGGLNDLRLYLAAGERGPDSELMVEWLSVVQDSLLAAMTDEPWPR